MILTLSLAPGLVTGEVSTYTVTGADAGETVVLMAGANDLGMGPCPPAIGMMCMGIVGPVRNVGSGIADASGTATIQMTPPNVVGFEVATQAIVKRGVGGADSLLSDPRVDEVFPPWVSGLASRPANPTCLAPIDPPVFDGDASVVRAFGNLTFDRPNTMAQPPGNPDLWWIAEQPGSVWRFDDDDGVLVADLVIDIEAEVDDTGNEQGLLGMAFHPNFAVNGEVFLSYIDDRGAAGDFTEITRYVSLDGGLTLDPTTKETLFELSQPFDNHNGGNILFGPDGYLYIGLGDGGGGGDPFDAGQDTFNLLGKFLRIDVDSAFPYAIPPDNPYADGIAGLPEIYAIGFRNPWRWSFDRSTGDLWVGDVGQNTLEEVDFVEIGGNYGWDLMEGDICHGGAACETIPGLIDPVIAYPRSLGFSVIGGTVYRGAAIPGLVGTYLYTDHFANDLWGLGFDELGEAFGFVVDTGLGFDTTSFAEDLDGELYMLGIGGTVHRIEAAGVPPVDDFPLVLSETGCFDAADPTIPLEGLIPYAPNSPVWHDDAFVRRWLAVPDGTTIDVDAEGAFDLPIGSVLAMELRVAGARVETRLLVRHDDGTWAGYTYAWDEAELDATLVDGSLTVPTADGGTWRIPSRAECMHCHTEVAGFTLGLEIGQLNGEIEYPSTGLSANQLFTLDDVGFFTDPLGNTPDQFFALPDPAIAPDRPAARSYLHANCSHCHQPGGPGLGGIDLRVTEIDPSGCELATVPVEGDLGVPGALVVDPGSSATSVLALRMHATDVNRMPPVGSVVVDPLGTSVVDGWIDAMAACP